MHTLIVIVLLTLTPIVQAGGTARCTTRYDEAFQRWVTECTDGSRAVTKYDPQFQRWRTDIVRAPKGDKTPQGWPSPGKPPRP